MNLSDGVYELVPTTTSGDPVIDGFSLNLTELNKDPDQRLKEPKADSASAQEGKPRCINPIIFTYIYIYSFDICCNDFIWAFTLLGVG